MTAAFVKDFGQIAMSPTLASTLTRAVEYASSQSHVEVTLEHLLLALAEDADAEIVLATSNVNVGQLKTDVATQLGQIEGRLPLDQTTTAKVSPEVRHILEAAAQAAQGRRNEINGAIVLAAIVGDGNSIAANLLRVQGLTFEAAIKALQSSLAARPRPRPQPPVETQPTAPPVQSQPEQRPVPTTATPTAEDFLARARAKVKSKAAAEQSDQSNDDSFFDEEGAKEDSSLTLETNAAEPQPQPDPLAHVPKTQPPPQRSPIPPAEAKPKPSPEPITAPPIPPLKKAPGAPRATHATPPPPPYSAAPAPAGQPPAGQRPGASWAPPKPARAPQGQPRPSRPPPPLPTAATPRTGATQPPPHVHPNQGLPSGPLPLGTRPQHAPAPPPGSPPPVTGGAPSPPWPAPPNAPQHPPMAAPQPNQTARSQNAPHPNTGFGGGNNQPHQHASARPAVEAGQLVENVPRTMQVDVPTLVEVSIADTNAGDITGTLQGSAPAHQHDIKVTKAMSVRLRSPDGGFFIETASPETQWIDRSLGIEPDDFARWRWNVTPKSRGKKRLQVIISARTVGADGLAAETALPEQVIEVKIRANYKKNAMSLAGWTIAAVLGGLLARFGENIWETGRLFVAALTSGG